MLHDGGLRQYVGVNQHLARYGAVASVGGGRVRKASSLTNGQLRLAAISESHERSVLCGRRLHCGCRGLEGCRQPGAVLTVRARLPNIGGVEHRFGSEQIVFITLIPLTSLLRTAWTPCAPENRSSR